MEYKRWANWHVLCDFDVIVIPNICSEMSETFLLIFPAHTCILQRNTHYRNALIYTSHYLTSHYLTIHFTYLNIITYVINEICFNEIYTSWTSLYTCLIWPKTCEHLLQSVSSSRCVRVFINLMSWDIGPVAGACVYSSN